MLRLLLFPRDAAFGGREGNQKTAGACRRFIQYDYFFSASDRLPVTSFVSAKSASALGSTIR